MILFGVAVTDAEQYEKYALPGLELVAEPDSKIIAHHTAGSVFRNYNILLDKAAEYEDLEALVLLHQDVELVDPDFAEIVRRALSDPQVAIVGCAGAVGVRSIAWWQGAVTWAGLTHRYPEHGGGEFPAISWSPYAVPAYAETGDVDSIDGFVMALSPWAIKELRFDESLGKLHGYDFDISMQAKAAGKKVVTAPFRAIHNHSLELINDPESWIKTYIRLAEKWADLLPDTGADPAYRALRAEADADCARAIAASFQMRERAVKRNLSRLKRRLERTEALLAATTDELQGVLRKAATPDTESGEDAIAPAGEELAPMSLPPGKTGTIDHAVEQLDVESFASLETGPTYGGYALYTIEKPGVKRGVLVDVALWRPRDQLLNIIEEASEHPRMRVLIDDYSDQKTVDRIGTVDAVFLIDVLVRMVDPDWDQVLDFYAPITSAFVITNPQWEGSKTTRLLDLEREEYLEAVPPWAPHEEVFDRFEEWLPEGDRLYRDTSNIWQWGITDADLVAKLERLGFGLELERTLAPTPGTNGFANRSFVFKRTEPEPRGKPDTLR